MVAFPILFAIFAPWKIEEWIKDMEADMSGGAIYYDIYGRQCTNAGKVTTKFYVPEFENNNVELYDTGRMYNGSYVNSTQTNYQYYLNHLFQEIFRYLKHYFLKPI